MITRMDWNIGRLVDTLERLHLAETPCWSSRATTVQRSSSAIKAQAPRWIATGRYVVISALSGKAAFEFRGWLAGQVRSVPARSARKTSTSPTCFRRWSLPPAERPMRPGISTALTYCPSGPARAMSPIEPCSGNGRAREPTSSPHCVEISSWWLHARRQARTLRPVPDPAERRDLAATHPQRSSSSIPSLPPGCATDDPRGKE